MAKVILANMISSSWVACVFAVAVSGLKQSNGAHVQTQINIGLMCEDMKAYRDTARLKSGAKLLHLSPLAGRGRRALARRVRGPLRESELVEKPPHPDPLPASGEREKQAEGNAS
jgi:hypothetical protein